MRACQRALQSLPSALALEPLLVHAAERCGEAQSRNHAVLVEGSEQLIEWAAEQQDTGDYLWWELAAGGHLLPGAARAVRGGRGPTTLAEAERIDSAYYPPICAISALLDSLVDLGDDAGGTNHSFVGHYPTSSLTSERFAAITREARLLSSVYAIIGATPSSSPASPASTSQPPGRAPSTLGLPRGVRSLVSGRPACPFSL